LITEGDHIKVTASQFPIPTVCADKQSTDWFHAISRTLKWNERERQKSFVVVEEGPAKEKHHEPPQRKNHPDPIVSASKGDGDEGDEASDGDDSDEEEEKFDIDDLSSDDSTSATSNAKESDSVESSTGTSPPTSAASRAAEAMMGVSPGTHAETRARSRSRSGVRSGVDSPNRYAPVPPRHHGQQGHVQWAAGVPDGGQHGRASQADAVGLGDNITPTASVHHARRTRSRSPGAPSFHPRAFAVWGQDESDSNSSDNDP
jgi:NAD+ kinase